MCVPPVFPNLPPVFPEGLLDHLKLVDDAPAASVIDHFDAELCQEASHGLFERSYSDLRLLSLPLSGEERQGSCPCGQIVTRGLFFPLAQYFSRFQIDQMHAGASDALNDL